jgi:hypothetical protein
MAKGDRGSEDQGGEVREMRNAATILDLIRERGRRKEKPQWVKRMAMRHRKTLVVCQMCHEEIHRERPSRRKPTTQITGKPT